MVAAVTSEPTDPIRRRNKDETQGDILQAASELFAARGFKGTSMRGVASAAGVDVALLSHYFGNKEGLFRAALHIPVDTKAVVAEVVTADRNEVGLRLITLALHLWDSAETGPAMVSLMRRAVGEESETQLLRNFFFTAVLESAADQLLGDLPKAEQRHRMGLVATQMLGLGITRCILKAEPIASLSPAELAAAVGPAIQHYLFGSLDETVPSVYLPASQPESRGNHE